MVREKFKNDIIFFVVFAFGILISFNFGLAESCPALTTVEGTTVNFVGELTDMGGDLTTSAWFEYGRTMSYGQRTSEEILTIPGIYCITTSGLDPGTTYHYRAVARNSAGTSYGSDRTFTTTSSPVSVDIRANNSDGSITIPYGTSATLSWTSSNANSCQTSGGWSGSRAISGSESTGNLTSSRTYTLTCSGSGGSASDSVTVNISSASTLTVNKLARNLSDGTGWLDSVSADPLEVIGFSIQITASGFPVSNINVRDILPDKLLYRNNSLKVDGVSFGGDILSGLNIGSLSTNQTKTITFEASVASPDKFLFGENQVINSVAVSGTNVSNSDTAKIIVSRTAVVGAATAVLTGLTNNLFLDSFFLPLLIAILIIWLFRSRIIKFEEWVDLGKQKYREGQAKKLLKIKIAKIKAQEFLGKKIF